MVRRIKRIKKLLTEAELGKIINVILTSTTYALQNPLGEFIRHRDKTCHILRAYCGLRPGEALNLRWEDIDFEKKEIRLQPYFNKQKIDLPATLTAPAERALVAYKNFLDVIGFHSTFLFPGTQSLQPMTVCGLRRRWRKACREAGINKVNFYDEKGAPRYDFNLYSGRIFFGSSIYKKTHSEKATQLLLRQLSMRSVEPYILPDQRDKQAIADKVFL